MRNLFLFLFTICLISCSTEPETSENDTIDTLVNDLDEAISSNIDSRDLKMSLINGQQLHGVTKFASGTLVEAIDDVGVPKGHTFKILSSNGNEMSFRFTDEGDSCKLIDYLGLNCSVDFIPVVQYGLVGLISEMDSVIMEEFKQQYFKYPAIEGTFTVPDNPIFSVLSTYSIIDSEGNEFSLEGTLSEEDIKYNGKQVKLHYKEEIKNFAMSINFEAK